jgi:hypothetical protein
VATVRYTTATVGATAATGALWTVLKANPFIVITAALAAIGVAMSLFGSNTRKAAADLRKLREEADLIQTRIATSKDFGKQVELSALRQQQSRLYDAAVEIRRYGQPVRYRDLIGSSGLGAQEFINMDQGLNISPTSALQISENTGIPGGFEYQIGARQVNPAEASKIYGRLYETLGSRISSIEQADQDAADAQREKAKQRAEEIKEAVKESNQALDEMIQKAESIGAALGGAWVDFLAGAGSAEQILKSLVFDIARQQASQSTANLFGSFFKPPPGANSAPNSPSSTTPAANSNGWGSAGGQAMFGGGVI